MILEITQQDIDKAVASRAKKQDYQTCRDCVVAVAMTRHFGELTTVGSCTYTKRESNKQYFLPPALQQYVVDFDNQQTLSPEIFTFKERRI